MASKIEVKKKTATKVIGQRHGKSTAQAKRIVYDAKRIIEEHM